MGAHAAAARHVHLPGFPVVELSSMSTPLSHVSGAARPAPQMLTVLATKDHWSENPRRARADVALGVVHLMSTLLAGITSTCGVLGLDPEVNVTHVSSDSFRPAVPRSKLSAAVLAATSNTCTGGCTDWVAAGTRRHAGQCRRRTRKRGRGRKREDARVWGMVRESARVRQSRERA